MNARNSTLFAHHDLIPFRSMREQKRKEKKHRRELRRLSVHCALYPHSTANQNRYFSSSIAPEHALHQLSQRSIPLTPLAATALVSQPKLLDKQDVMLEAGVQVRLQTQTAHDRVVVAVDVCVDPVQSLEDLADVLFKVGGEWHAGCGREELGIRQVVARPREEV
jgi:hypothetical protein